ncbi:MAG: rRNA maturation RNase YbeY [Chlamydiae bacterium RIFCSPLOWO2_12_FULL_49_12]|nr:MAG: rRNA maturation RNase YbeY [Chlamydiae bacterium GWA2_50_15]OGN55923.1 MAG: rRNA maturation RNase YbeY [Chlamydiae bacterium GWF2_49_8]OGN59106.1 MAG: rRNA maturation RNase YbeY [Chlamydiae bacterium RIFCSPHIGHO2_02_FULL_49_29]OGN62467.1 MAG: rRNA maturation RNase YbeY [Chlamydiae bacterium RIFCSPHIGHO2_12_FULL_49_32]OGN69130.1 MAG: rRNA maturation RNase YbeY [Chlamydiae bacterium RIFCSPLOWO2_02_FULL_49_12]OGN71660.1 MAG: rRNA maturation RNase YbeY [Chlamydiae bacterium RIFCSPLOWO2_12_
MQITVYSSQRDLKLSVFSIRKMVKALLNYWGVFPDEVVVGFVSKQKITTLHGRFFNDPTPTDCLAFPVDSSLLGEVVLCPRVAKEYADARGKDPYQEISLYLIHALLHLLGYTDRPKKERERMRRKEKMSLNYLQEKGLLLS